MRFDTNSQLWVDDNGQPMVVQPPKPTGNGYSISANQAPINFNVSNFANQPLPITTSDGQQYQPQSFDFSTPDLGIPQQQLPDNLGAIDKMKVSQMANFNQGITNAGSGFTGANANLTSEVTNQNPNNQNGANGLLNIFSNMGQSYSLESSLYGLGSALGKKDYTGMTEQEIGRSKANDTFSAIGNAGKLLLGGTRSLLSGAAASHMNNWNINEYKRRRRENLVNNQPGVENAYATIGGAPQYQDGGQVLVPPPISAELDGNPDNVYDFRPSSNGSVMSLLTGRPSGYDIDPNVSQASIDQALRSLPRRSSGIVSNNSNTVVNDAPVAQNPSSVSYDNMDFKTAFNQAYNDKGEGQVFNWKGKVYLLSKKANANNTAMPTKTKNTPNSSVIEKEQPTKTSSKEQKKVSNKQLSQEEIDRIKALFKRNGVTTSNYIIPAWRPDSQVMNLQNPIRKFQDGGEVVNDDVMTQLQQAVENGDISPEDAQAYMQQIQAQGNPEEELQEQPNVNDIQGQLTQAVQNGEISEEEANAYLQQMQQEPQPQQPQAPQEPQMTPEEAQAQLAQAVQNGDISQEEAQTYLQQMFGENISPNSQPLEPYTGAVRENIKPEEYLTGEVTTGDENKPYNAEVEKGEYVNRDGVTQQVVGDKHSKGGEKMNLQDGTIIISDKKRLGATNARALSLQTGLKLKAGDTFAQVVDIFNRKIGLEKLNTEQEELFKKLKKIGDQGNLKTQELNNEFLNAKINDIEQKKSGLLDQREQLVQVLFQMQEADKTPTADTSGNVPEYQDGGRVGEYVLDRYGNDAYQYYLDNWKNDPDYNFRDYAQMRNRLKGFASDYGVALPEGFDRFNEAQMDAFAGQLQKTVPNEVATHYGTYVAPTQSGLQWLVDQGIVNKDNPALKKVIRNGKVTVGSYGSLGKDQQQVIADAVDNLDPTTLNNYATANFRDSKWFYRRPKEETIYYRDKNEFDNVINNSPKVGDGVFFSGKSGAYFRPRLLQEKTLGSQKEVDDYIKQYGNNPDTIHKNFLSEGDPMVYNLVRAQDPAITPEAPAQNPLANLGRKVRRNNFLLPDQSTLPPEALRSVPKYDIHYNYLDNIRLSPEQNLLENYRAYDEARGKMEGLPDTVNQANLAMLAGNVAQANNQAINQINAQNVQNAQQVAQANLQTLNRQAEMDLNLADQYDQRMNRALDVTRKDIEGYYDFNRRVNVGEFNTRHQLNLLNDLFNNYGINPDGSIGFDPKTVAPYTVDRFEAIRAQQLQEELKRRKQASSTTQTPAKTKVSDNWGK